VLRSAILANQNDLLEAEERLKESHEKVDRLSDDPSTLSLDEEASLQEMVDIKAAREMLQKELEAAEPGVQEAYLTYKEEGFNGRNRVEFRRSPTTYSGIPIPEGDLRLLHFTPKDRVKFFLAKCPKNWVSWMKALRVPLETMDDVKRAMLLLVSAANEGGEQILPLGSKSAKKEGSRQDKDGPGPKPKAPQVGGKGVGENGGHSGKAAARGGKGSRGGKGGFGRGGGTWGSPRYNPQTPHHHNSPPAHRPSTPAAPRRTTRTTAGQPPSFYTPSKQVNAVGAAPVMSLEEWQDQVNSQYTNDSNNTQGAGGDATDTHHAGVNALEGTLTPQADDMMSDTASQMSHQSQSTGTGALPDVPPLEEMGKSKAAAKRSRRKSRKKAQGAVGRQQISPASDLKERMRQQREMRAREYAEAGWATPKTSRTAPISGMAQSTGAGQYPSREIEVKDGAR
jgi:hypothetical protein